MSGLQQPNQENLTRRSRGIRKQPLIAELILVFPGQAGTSGKIVLFSDVLIPTSDTGKFLMPHPRGRRFVAAVVLAAGLSTRLGRLKQLTSLGGRPLMERTLEAVRRSKVNQRIIVLGYRSGEVRREIDLSSFTVVTNRSFRQGMSTSVKVGLSAVDGRAAAALIVLADQPFLSGSLIDRIVELFQRSDALIVAPTYGGVQGNPVLLSRRLFSEMSTISGDVGAKSLLDRHREDLLEYPVRRARHLLDIDTPQDLAMARAFLKKASKARRRLAQ